MKYYELTEHLRMVRILYCTAIKEYVLSKGGKVECDQTERECYLRRVKFKSLHMEDKHHLFVYYLLYNTKLDNWEEHRHQIEYFGWNDLVHITEDIISEEETDD